MVGTIPSPGYFRLNMSISSSVVHDVKYETVFISRDNDVNYGTVFTSALMVYIVMMDWSVYTQQEMAHEPLKKKKRKRGCKSSVFTAVTRITLGCHMYQKERLKIVHSQ